MWLDIALRYTRMQSLMEGAHRSARKAFSETTNLACNTNTTKGGMISRWLKASSVRTPSHGVIAPPCLVTFIVINYMVDKLPCVSMPCHQCQREVEVNHVLLKKCGNLTSTYNLPSHHACAYLHLLFHRILLSWFFWKVTREAHSPDARVPETPLSSFNSTIPTPNPAGYA